MNCQESIATPLKPLHTRDLQGFKQSCNQLRAFPFIGVGRYYLLDCIEDYSSRALTYDSDAINAFSGVLRLHQQLKYPVHHLWGLPVFPTHTEQVQHGKEYRAKGEDVTQRPGVQVEFALAWATSQPARRRFGFLSWSWVGWTKCRRADVSKEIWKYELFLDWWRSRRPSFG